LEANPKSETRNKCETGKWQTGRRGLFASSLFQASKFFRIEDFGFPFGVKLETIQQGKGDRANGRAGICFFLFELRNCFGFRISDFGFRRQPR
jgi:hypothetical protein